MNNKISAYRDRLSVAHAGRENPSGDDLNRLLLEIVPSARQYRRFTNMSVLADHPVHLNVIPGPGPCSNRLWCGLNDGAPVLLAGSKRDRIRRGQRGPVDGAIRR